MKIAILNDEHGFNFAGEQYIVDLGRCFGGYTPGDLICRACPFGPVQLPLELELAIRADGGMTFRKWSFTDKGINSYLHTSELSVNSKELAERPLARPFIPTEEQIDTVNGLFSGRIRFEGLKLIVGATVLRICPLDLAREKKLAGKKLFLA